MSFKVCFVHVGRFFPVSLHSSISVFYILLVNYHCLHCFDRTYNKKYSDQAVVDPISAGVNPERVVNST